MDLVNFCRSLPKVELHAHLNGSLSLSTLEKLHKMQNIDGTVLNQRTMNAENYSSLGECFKMFDTVHNLTNTPDAVFVATCDVIKEFMEDKVIYLELRTTPRAVEGSMTKEEYLNAVIKALRLCKVQMPSILVKLLISIDRRHGFKFAEENIKLARVFKIRYPEYVVGIDVSGDPTKGDAFLELLKNPQKEGFKITIHCAETSNETEAMNILAFKPDRLGHCTCIHPNLDGSRKLFDTLLKSKIPVELCLTSNVKCKTVSSYATHQFKYLYEAGHPICISTDDKGIFDTCLSKEMEIAASHFNLDREDLAKLSMLSVHYAFANEEEKNKLLWNFREYDSFLNETVNPVICNNK